MTKKANPHTIAFQNQNLKMIKLIVPGITRHAELGCDIGRIKRNTSDACLKQDKIRRVWKAGPFRCHHNRPTRSSSAIKRRRASGNCLSIGQSTRRSRK